MTTPLPLLPEDRRIAARADEYDARYGVELLAAAMAQALKDPK